MSDFLSIGLDFLQKKDFRLAYESFSRAIEKDPNNAEAYLKRGDMHLNHLNNFNKAIEDLSKAIEINPNFAYAYKLRGISFKKIDDSNMAKQDWKKASTLGDIECSNWIKNKKFKRLDQLSKKDFEKISNENLKELFKAELKILQLENINNSFTNRIKILKDLIFEIENKIYKNPYHNHYDVQNFSQKIKKVNNKEISTTFSKRKRYSFILFRDYNIEYFLLGEISKYFNNEPKH